MNEVIAIGFMSGSSLDGIDLCCVKLKQPRPNSYQFEFLATKTYKFHFDLKHLLEQSCPLEDPPSQEVCEAFDLFSIDCIKHFIRTYTSGLCIDFIASHGHTLKHQPDEGITLQIGDGRRWASALGIPVVYDFRTQDVLLGGQGAPLVPIGDQLLFSSYPICLNLGGISNLSYQKDGSRLAFDVGMFNTPLNECAGLLGQPYDSMGNIARSGSLIEPLFEEMNQLAYFKKEGPKSLGREWYETYMQPLLKANITSIPNLLHTLVKHQVYQLVQAIHTLELDTSTYSPAEILVTGGGAYNQFAMEVLSAQLSTSYSLVIADKDLIEFKEALIFALMGWLRLEGKVNVLKSVTGASADSSSGRIAYVNRQFVP